MNFATSFSFTIDITFAQYANRANSLYCQDGFASQASFWDIVDAAPGVQIVAPSAVDQIYSSSPWSLARTV